MTLMPRASSEEERRKDLNARLSAVNRQQQEQLAQDRAAKHNLPYISLTTFPIDPDVVEHLPREQAQAAQAVLFYKQGKDARLGVVDPTRPEVAAAVEYLQKQLALDPELYVISQRSLKTALARYRPPRAAEKPEDELEVSGQTMSQFEEATQAIKDLGAHITKLSPTELLSTFAAGAVKLGASDLHIEPYQNAARLRYRIDGVLQDVTTFPPSGWRLLLSRVKVLSSLKLNVHDVPQDGSFVLKIADKTYDVRVSILPGDAGENIVLRILDRDTKALRITDLGMKQRDYAVVTDQLKASNGMILITGPTGSGKTTTLASFLQEVNKPELKIITLENPIEYRLPGVEQTQIDHAAGYTFAVGLRAILRQDPDIIMVGEIRDAETAETAIDASLTGHLVFSTLHTNNAPAAVPRLIDLGVTANVLAPAINLIIAQRLVRVVCRECAESYQPTAVVRDRIADTMRGLARDIFNPAVVRQRDLTFLKAKGCAACHRTGYRGRIGIFEVMPVERDVEELVLAGADENRLRDAAQKAGMTTILQDGFLKVIDKVTTIEEVERVTEQ